MDMVALELIRHLQQIDRENEYCIFVSPDEDDKVLSETGNFRIIRVEGGFYPYWEQVSLPRAAREMGCEILHCTSNTAPVRTSIPLVVTLHDIIYMEHGYLDLLAGNGTAYQKFGNAYRRSVVPRVVERSRRIITVSEFEQRRIGEFFRMGDDARLTVVYNGVSSHFRKVTDKNELARVREKYHLPERFFFFLGNTDPKKNTKGVLRAFSGYCRMNQDGTQLVMPDYESKALVQLLEEIGDAGLMNRILLPGYVANTDLPAIYSQCSIFLYPSLRESFGIPLLEAMSCGAPVITSSTSSMPEVAGKAALFVDPFKTEEITGAMKELSVNRDLRDKLIAEGYLRAAKFSWRSMAEKVLQVYREVAAGSN